MPDTNAPFRHVFLEIADWVQRCLAISGQNQENLKRLDFERKLSLSVCPCGNEYIQVLKTCQLQSL